jgi:hypothetical protein
MEAENPEEVIDEIDLEELFYPPPTNDGSSILCSSFAKFGIICFLGGFSG